MNTEEKKERIEGRAGEVYEIDGIRYRAERAYSCQLCAGGNDKKLCKALPICMLADFETSLIYVREDA